MYASRAGVVKYLFLTWACASCDGDVQNGAAPNEHPFLRSLLQQKRAGEVIIVVTKATMAIIANLEDATLADVKNLRAQPTLPTAAFDISMQKQAVSYRARYTNANAEFHAYLDNLWYEYGKHSAVARGEMWREGSANSMEDREAVFAEHGWKPLENATVYYNPSELVGCDGTCFFYSNAGVAMQRTGHW